MSQMVNSVFSYGQPHKKPVVPFSGRQTRLALQANWALWQDEVLGRLQDLVRLERGWDGYDAPAVSLENAYFAIQMLRAISPADMIAPQIVPGSSGDLQIEWHLDDKSVELHVKSPNSVTAWRESENC